ncbi:MAG: hypothetical protein WC175_03240, partial [Candidatus Dojkabacteria bacterium]
NVHLLLALLVHLQLVVMDIKQQYLVQIIVVWETLRIVTAQSHVLCHHVPRNILQLIWDLDLWFMIDVLIPVANQEHKLATANHVHQTPVLHNILLQTKDMEA